MLLFIDFADSGSQRDPQALSEFVLPVASWFRQASHGRLQLEIVPILKRYVVRSSYLDHPAPYGYIDPAPILREAIEAADPEVDFRGTDIVFVSAPHRLSWAYVSTGAGIVADGQAVRFGAVFGETWLSPIVALAYIIHETGHFLGLPDLYSVGHNPPEFPHSYYGHWDPMAMVARHTDFNSWHKLKLGWIDASRIKSLEWGSIEVTLAPIGHPTGLMAVVVPTTEVTAYFIEVRKSSGLDALMCRDGVLISMVDTTIPSGWGPIRVRRSQLGLEPLAGCNDPSYAAPFDLHSGGPTQYHDPTTGLRVQLLARDVDGSYRLRVSRRR